MKWGRGAAGKEGPAAGKEGPAAGAPARRPDSPKRGAARWLSPGPAPVPKEEDRDPREGEIKEGPYPAGSGRGARSGLHQRPRSARRPGCGGGSPALWPLHNHRKPGPARPGRKTLRPRGGAGQGRWGGAEGAGRGLEEGGAGPEAKPGVSPVGGALGPMDSPLPGQREELPAGFPAPLGPV